MAGSKEIRTKIKSVQNTRKITKAMEMVAASKMRKAQERMRAARPYAEKIRNIAAHIVAGQSGIRAPVPGARDGRHAQRRHHRGHHGQGPVRRAQHQHAAHAAVAACASGKPTGDAHSTCAASATRAWAFLQRLGANVVAQVVHWATRRTLDKLIGPVKVMLDAYAEGELRCGIPCYTRFINTMKQEPVMEQLLPLSAERLRQSPQNGSRLGLPLRARRASVIDELLARYIEALIYQAVAENMASEQSARMVAMKAATDNAGSVIDELQLVYNKSRQAGDHQGNVGDRGRRGRGLA